jgi:hypothetical protein
VYINVFFSYTLARKVKKYYAIIKGLLLKDTSEKFNKCVIPGLTLKPSCRLAHTFKDGCPKTSSA